MPTTPKPKQPNHNFPPTPHSPLINKQKSSKLLHSQHSYQSCQIKSPSPDQIHRCGRLTPSKIKYIGQGHNKIKGMQRTPYCSEKNFVKVFDSIEMKQESKIYITQLQQQIHSLSKQNSQLLKRLQSVSDIKQQQQSTKNLQIDTQLRKSYQSHTIPQTSSLNTISNNTSNTKFQKNNGRSRNLLIIQKIKQQYRDNISTLKYMIEQQMKDSFSIIEDALLALNSQTNKLQTKITDIQEIISQLKIKYIQNLQQRNNTNNHKEIRNQALNSNIKIKNQTYSQNTISDILCVSIPEQQWEESKNMTVVYRLEEEIDRLRSIIDENQRLYKVEKQMLMEQIKGKEGKISQLEEKISGAGSVISMKTVLKDQLLNLQDSITEIGTQLLETKQAYRRSLIQLQQKTNQVEINTRQILLLRDKVMDQQKHRMLLQQKNHYLEGNLVIAEKQLKQRKIMLEDMINARATLEQQRINRYRSQYKINSEGGSTNLLLEFSNKIDKLLKLQESIIYKTTFQGYHSNSPTVSYNQYHYISQEQNINGTALYSPKKSHKNT